jgi:two-component system, OmpR family, phosphate regulon sensor histidine kinase PhoR
MFSSQLFWKLMLVCAGLNIAAAIIIGLILTGWLADRLDEEVDARLRDAALLVRGEMAEETAAGASDVLQRRIAEFGKETGLRFTLVAMDGAVLADSTKPTLAGAAAMENHRDKPEIAMARSRGEGAASRTSSSFGVPYRYLAMRVDVDGKPVGVVRSSVPESSVDAQIDAMQRRVWGSIAVVSMVVLALSYWILGRIVAPLSSLTAAAEAIAGGDYQHRVYVANRDELGRLARTFNRMSQEFSTRMTQLSQTSDRQSTVLGGMIEGVIAVDGRQRIVLANQAAGRLFDFRPPATEGRPLLEVVRNHAVHEAVNKALETGRPQRLETSREGTRQSVDVHVQPLPGDPCPGVVLVMHDTTELRRLESLRRDFVANVSHELKTPLTSIKAYTETLRNGAMNDPETSQKFLARIEEQSERLHYLIMDMLMLARIESDQQVFEIVPVNVGEVVGQCVEDRRRAAEAKRINLSAEPNLPTASVRADREGLREMLDNLIDNAIKYTPEGGSVTICWQSESPQREQGNSVPEPAVPSLQPRLVTISVRDTGIGIKAEEQKRVFERFYRVDKARSRELGGTGLGLSIVKHLAQSFGGNVGVESEPGKGSTFSITLPLA